MSPRTKTIISAALAAALAFAIGSATRAVAGRKETWAVTVDTVSRRAYGAIGSARNSPDRTQSIGCSTFYDPANRVNQATCIAVDERGRSASCVTQDPTMVAVTFAFTSDSYVEFSWNETGACNSLQVSNISNFEPKQP